MGQHRIRQLTRLLALAALVLVAACSSRTPVQVPVTIPSPPAPAPTLSSSVPLPAPASLATPTASGVQTGLASYYHPSLHGNETASGILYDDDALMAAHPTLPLGSVVRVTNLESAGRQVEVRITDRGPTQENVDEGVVIDLSGAAAARIDMLEAGRVAVQLEVLEWGED